MIKYADEQAQYNVDENEYKQDDIQLAQYYNLNGIFIAA